MATYATVADFLEYVPGFVVEDEQSLEGVLRDAEMDIDSAIGRFDYNPEEVLKVDLTLLDTRTTEFLSRAVCAQAEYRMLMGDEFFVQGERREVVGRSVDIHKPPIIGPKARQELARGKLYRLSGRGRGTNWLPNQNVEDYIP